MTALDLFKDIEELEKKYSMPYHEIFALIKNSEIHLPLSIFSKDLGAFESIVRYLKDSLDLSFKQISILTKRKIQAVRTTYNRAKGKDHRDASPTKDTIPLNVIHDHNLSVLENIVNYFLQIGMDIHSISRVMDRNYKTIWTIKQRIKGKL